MTKVSLGTPAGAVLSALLTLQTIGCGGMHDTRPMTAQEQQSLVSRLTPSEVPQVDGLMSVGGRVQIAAPPAKVWHVMALHFGEVERWAGAGIATSACTSSDTAGVGATRSCRIADHMPFFGGDIYEERMIGWDESRGYFSAVQTRATGPTSLLVTENWIASDGADGTVVTQVVHMDMTFPMSMMGAGSAFKRKLVESLIGLKHYCETNEPVTPSNWEVVVKRYPEVLKDNQT